MTPDNAAPKCAHSPEPWRESEPCYTDSGGMYYPIDDANGNEVCGECEPSEADRARIVACVNACAGLTLDEVKALSAKLGRQVLSDSDLLAQYAPQRSGPFGDRGFIKGVRWAEKYYGITPPTEDSANG